MSFERVAKFISAENWLDQIVTNPETRKRVKVRSLPKELRKRYKPQKPKSDLAIKHEKIDNFVKELKKDPEKAHELLKKLTKFDSKKDKLSPARVRDIIKTELLRPQNAKHLN